MIDMEDGKKKIEEQLDRSEAWIRDRLFVTPDDQVRLLRKAGY